MSVFIKGFCLFIFIIINDVNCALLECDTDPCIIIPNSNDVVLCVNTLNECLINCTDKSQCKGTATEHLIVYSGAINTTILCDNEESCVFMEVYIGEFNITNDTNSLYSLNMNHFSGNKSSVTIDCDHISSCKDTSIYINGSFSNGVNIIGYDDDSLKQARIECSLDNNQYCRLFCGEPNVASCDSVSYICNSGICQCTGLSCPVISMNSNSPTTKPVITFNPSYNPTNIPTVFTHSPSSLSPTLPSPSPTIQPTIVTGKPSYEPTSTPTISTPEPSSTPTVFISPTHNPTAPSIFPSVSPTLFPSIPPTLGTINPSTLDPTISTNFPSDTPTLKPTLSTNVPTKTPTVKVITIKPKKGETIICTNEYFMCTIECNEEYQCTEGVVVYSGAINTRIKCTRDQSCIGATFHIGIPSRIPIHYSISHFDGIKSSFSISCTKDHSCQYATININGYFEENIMIGTVGVDAFEEGILDVNLHNNDNTCNLYCNDISFASCEDATYNCGSNGLCLCHGSGCPNITTQSPTQMTSNPSIKPTNIPTISPTIKPTNLPSITPTESPVIVIINTNEYYNNFPDYGYGIIGASFLFLVAFCFCGKYTIKKRKRDENDSISSTQNAKLLDNDSNHYSEQKYRTFNDKNNIEIGNIPTQGTSLLSYTYFQK